LRKLYGEEHPEVASAYGQLGVRLEMKHRCAEALKATQRAAQLQEKLHGSDHPQVGYALLNVCACQTLLGGFDAAISSGLRAMDILRSSAGDDALVTNVLRLNLGEAYRDAGQVAEARSTFETAWNFLVRQLPPTEGLMLMLGDDLASTQLLAGDYRAAEASYRKLLAYPDGVGTPDDRVRWRLRLAQSLLGMGSVAAGEAELGKISPALARAEGLLSAEGHFARAQLAWAKGARGPELSLLLDDAERGFESGKRMARAADVRAWARARGI
jgi:tetratricopeptide (TPR) repeat protein